MTFHVWTVTGDLIFDYFFTQIVMLGCIAIVPAQIFKLLR